MSFCLEWKKMKRTGFYLSFFCGGILAAAVPVLNMVFRSEIYLPLDAPPIQILMDANWQMIAMLNILAVAAGACLQYHTEYADGSYAKMCSLPVKERRLFFGKLALMAAMLVMLLAIEAAGMAFSAYHWFWEFQMGEMLKNVMYAFWLMLPAASGFLLIASVCKNMWVSLGISVVCIFTASMLPTKNFALSLFPFALPFQMFAGTVENVVYRYIAAAAAEFFFIAAAEELLLKVRRLFI